MSIESVDLMELLQLEDVPPGEQRKLAEAVGIEAYRALAGMYAGTTIYIPTVDTLTRNVRDKRIKEEYTGYNHRELAVKYGITEQWVRMIVGPVIPPIDGQVSLFDDAQEAV